MSGTKYKGTALIVRWLYSGGTTILSAESRTFEESETANTIDVTVRTDTAKNELIDFPDITVSMKGLDTSGTAALATSQPWDSLNIGDNGTVEWSPEGTVTNYRKRTLAARVKEKTFSSPYDGAVEWGLQWTASGGTVVQSAW